MRLKLFLKQAKSFFVSTSWTDTFVEWLVRIPLPYWLTCTLISIGITSISWLFNYNDIVNNGKDLTYNTTFSYFELATYSFLFPYGLYIYWLINKEKKVLNQGFPAPEEENKSTLSIIVKTLFRIVAIYIILYNWADILYLYSERTLECLKLLFTTTIAIFDLITMLVVALKVIELFSFVYRMRLRNIKIDLLDLHSIYSLSKATQKVSLYLMPFTIALGAYSLWAYSAYDEITISTMRSQLFAFTTLTATLIAGLFLVFTMPVFWIRERIIEAKEKALSKMGQKLRINFEKQDQLAKQGKFEEAAEIKGYIDSLFSRREFLRNISEWPWETRTFREFSAAILLPIILWLMQFYISLWLEK